MTYNIPNFRRGRPRRADLEQLRRENRQAEYEHLARQEAMKDQLAQVVERIKGRSGSGMGQEFAEMMQVFLSMGTAPFHAPHSNLNMESALANFVREQADNLAGLHVSGDYRQHPRDEVEIYDFAALAQGSTRIRYFPKGDPEDDDAPKPYMEIWHRDDVEQLHGDVAEAFLGYLHFSGVFLVEDAKRPCPDCADEPPRDCETCGGLRWIIPEPEPTFPVTGEDTPVPPLRARLVACDDPTVNDAMKTLLDANLRAISLFQSIQRWCHSGPETPAGEALHAIERLVDEALKPTREFHLELGKTPPNADQ